MRKCINEIQKKCNDNFISLADNKCKATWNVVNRKLGNVRKSSEIDRIEINDKIIMTGTDIAEAFNNYFINLSNNYNDIKSSKYDLSNTIPNNLNSIYLEPTTPEEVLKLILSLRNTNSVGYDKVSTMALKNIAHLIAEPLCHIINLSLEQGTFPQKLKFAVVKPLHKKGSKADMGKYRPITLTPVLSKVFEKVFYIRLQKFLDKNKAFAKEQNGFRSNKSTALAAFTLIRKVLDSINNRNPTIALFLDMSKAFDFVDHDILISKLHRYGIRGPAGNWIKSYLSNRCQVTEITKMNKTNRTVENFVSTIKENKYGVPQGSILGPLLFLVYINDLPRAVNYPTVLFADDTTIVVESDNLSNYEEKINKALSETVNWLRSNNLNLNTEKTKFIHFHTKQSKDLELNITCDGKPIKQENCHKFLGINIDKHCDWKEQIKAVCSKINKFVFALKKIRLVISHKTALLVYYGYVCSALRYGIILWGNATDVHRVFISQKRCIRAIWGLSPRDSCKPIFRKNKILTLTCLYILEACTFVRKHMELFIVKDNRNKRTITQKPLILPVTKLSLFKKNSYYMLSKIYNTVPKTITNLTGNIFYSKLRQWLQEECYYSVNEFFEKNN